MPSAKTNSLPDHEMLFIEGGTFQMGSESEDAFGDEKPIHEVKVSSFYMGKYPVTQALWKYVRGEATNPSFFRGDKRPVESVSWEEVQEFITKLNKKTNQKYRLPTEAEWEYAARGGAKGKEKNYLYSGSNKLKEVAWYDANSYDETKEVGLLRPNVLGINDMSGNVFEYCQDWHGGSEYYQECFDEGVVINPQGPSEGTSRVIRGGSWLIDPEFCRCSIRGGWIPGLRDYFVGFRLVLPFQFTL